MAPSAKDVKKPRLVSLMTLQDVQRETGISYMSLRRLVLEGHLPHVEIPGRRRFWVKRTDMEKLIETSTSSTRG